MLNFIESLGAATDGSCESYTDVAIQRRELRADEACTYELRRKTRDQPMALGALTVSVQSPARRCLRLGQRSQRLSHTGASSSDRHRARAPGPTAPTAARHAPARIPCARQDTLTAPPAPRHGHESKKRSACAIAVGEHVRFMLARLLARARLQSFLGASRGDWCPKRRDSLARVWILRRL